MSRWKWDSLPFGENPTNTNPSNLGTMFFKHRFPGHYRDPETELHQNWNRDYDPTLGRYITSDLIGLAARPNIYLYVEGHPASSSDPTGLVDVGTMPPNIIDFLRNVFGPDWNKFAKDIIISPINKAAD